jgi:DtxR family manganese transport transcriptional regulator
MSLGQKKPDPRTGVDKSNVDDAVVSQRHGHVRSQRSLALIENYVELIAAFQHEHGEARVTEIAHRLGVAHPTAVKSVARLERLGLVTSRPYRGIFLTEARSILAERERARHLLVVDVLLAIGVPREATETDAEGIEHYVSERTLTAFKTYLKGLSKL